MLLKQFKDGEARLENEYVRSVSWEGNVRAQTVVNKVFDVVHGRWRGLGRLPFSALRLKEEYSVYDAKRRYDLKERQGRDLMPGCLCHLVMIGKIKPSECPLFMKACTPQKPRGACMVSTEGTCSIWAKHRVK